MKLSDVKNLLTGLRAQRKSIKQSIKDIRAAIQAEREELGKISSMGITLEDHVNHHKAYLEKEEELLKNNIRAYIKGEPRYNEFPATVEPRNLIRYLIPFGSKHSRGGAVPRLEWVLVIGGDFKKLAALIEDELKKVEGWGTVGQAEKHKIIERHRKTIQELEAALAELQNEQL